MPSETYTCGEGDSFPSIAKQKGFFWKTLWNHGDNAELKAKRKNPNVLYPGDKVVIPELTKKKENRAADAHHKFVRKGEPCKIAIKLFKPDGTPLANAPYKLEINGKTFQGSTDGDGQVKQAVPNDASEGLLIINEGADDEVKKFIRIGALKPIDTTIGVQQRLKNLGFDCPQSNKIDDGTTRAITQFQAQNNIEPSGELTDETKSKIDEMTQ